MKKIALCTALFFLISCEIAVNTEMYVSDIVDYMSNKTEKKELMMNCNVDLEISSEDEYNKEPEKYLNILSNAFYEAKNPAVTKQDMKTYLSAKGKIYFGREIIKKTNEDTEKEDEEADKSLIYFTCDEDEKYINIYLNFEKDKYNQLNYTVKENTYQDIELKDFNISIEVQNDQNEPCVLIINFSYVNNEPVLYNKSFTIEKREKLDIDITNIFKDYTFQNGKECIIKILKKNKVIKTEIK